MSIERVREIKSVLALACLACLVALALGIIFSSFLLLFYSIKTRPDKSRQVQTSPDKSRQVKTREDEQRLRLRQNLAQGISLQPSWVQASTVLNLPTPCTSIRHLLRRRTSNAKLPEEMKHKARYGDPPSRHLTSRHVTDITRNTGYHVSQSVTPKSRQHDFHGCSHSTHAQQTSTHALKGIMALGTPAHTHIHHGHVIEFHTSANSIK